MSELHSYTATRYVQPLREGGSLPAIVDTDGGGLFVAKFRGAGQGAKALIAEVIAGRIAQAIGLPTPELALIQVHESFGRSEPDPEIQDLLRASHGINVGLRYLDGAFNFDSSAAGEFISSGLAAHIVWLDAFLTNPDRTHRNPNLLIWNREPWLIDHGSALYAHHDWQSADESRTRTPFPLIEKHVLLMHSDGIEQADDELSARLTPEVLATAIAAVPDDLLLYGTSGADFATPDAVRERYLKYLTTRLRAPREFVAEAADARARAGRTPAIRLAARR